MKKNIVESQKNSYHLVALVHGDCHFRNVLVDAKNNVFLVDFEFFSEGPLLKDVAKLESDLLYVHSNVSDCFRDALDLSDRLFAIQDLREGFNTPLDSDAHSPLSKTISALKSIRSCAAICEFFFLVFFFFKTGGKNASDWTTWKKCGRYVVGQASICIACHDVFLLGG